MLLCAAIGLCAGLTSCDDDDDTSQRSYNLDGIEYAYVPHTGDGVTTEWKDFSVQYTNDGDTVMTVRYNPCEGMFDETTFVPDDPASFQLQGANFRDTLWVADVHDYNGAPVDNTGRQIPYIGETYRSEPDWATLPDFTLEVQPHSSVYYDGTIRIDRIVATYTITLEDSGTRDIVEVTGKIIKEGPTAWAWGEFNPYPDN